VCWQRRKKKNSPPHTVCPDEEGKRKEWLVGRKNTRNVLKLREGRGNSPNMKSAHWRGERRAGCTTQKRGEGEGRID